MKSINFKEKLDKLKEDVLESIERIIRTQPNWYLQIDDHRGNLTVNRIDDQESEIIWSVTVKERNGIEYVAMWYGVYEEEALIDAIDLDILLLIEVLGAMEIATQ